MALIHADSFYAHKYLTHFFTCVHMYLCTFFLSYKLIHSLKVKIVIVWQLMAETQYTCQSQHTSSCTLHEGVGLYSKYRFQDISRSQIHVLKFNMVLLPQETQDGLELQKRPHEF